MKNLILISLTSLLILGFITACSQTGGGTGSAGSIPSTADDAYAGPGSSWELETEGNTYTFTKETSDGTVTINATGNDLSTGHTKITVSGASATGTASAPSGGSVAHAVEVPGTAFLLKPFESGSETIAMLNAGSCPEEDFSANWVIGKRDPTNNNASLTSTSQDWYGSINFDVSEGSATFPDYRALEAHTDIGAQNTPQSFGVCSNGKVEWQQTCNSNSRDNEIYFTESGLMIVATCKEEPQDESHIIAIPQVEISSITDLYADYAGFVFDANAEETYPLTATIEADGSNTKVSLETLSGEDLTTTVASYDFSINHSSGVNTPNDGFLHGNFSSCTTSGGDGTCQTACVVAQNVNSSGKDMIYCIGQHPSNESKRMTILMVEK